MESVFSSRTTATFYDCVTPSIFFGLIMGTTPIFPVKARASRQFIINKYLKSLSLIYLILYTIIIIIGQKDSNRISRTYKKTDSVANVTKAITFFMTTVTTYTIYINGFRKVYKIKEILKSISEVDKTLKRMGQQFQYRTDVMYQYVVITSFQLFQFLLFGMQTWNAPREYLPVITFKIGLMNLLPLILQNLMESQFVLLTMSIYQRFHMINQHMLRIGFSTKDEQDKFTLQKICTLMELHDKLCDISFLIDDAYGGQMFASTLTQFELIVTKLFSLYKNYAQTPIDSLFSLGWGILKTLELLRKVTACHITGNQASYTKVVIHKLLLCESYNEYTIKLMEFSQQLMHRRVTFTASEMFSLDATLLFTVISTVANYIVILYQFSEASQPPTCIITPTNFTNYTST